MGGFVSIAKTSDLLPGTMKKVTVMGQSLLLARDGDRYYCTDASCPHLSGDLSKGALAGRIVTCPLHHSRFDLADGHVVRWTDLTGIRLTVATNQRPPQPLVTRRLKIEGEDILVFLQGPQE
jgi:3-phenylpropionate/trans-cinnamate dioxygenase ferredoxin subunit